MDKLKNQLQVSVSNNSFVDEGDGVISFPQGLTITDDSVMRSGTRYDIGSLDITKYQGQLTADHQDSLGTLIGKVIGTVKEGNRVAVQGIKYAVTQNPYARMAYDLLVGGFSNSFSIETIGGWPDQQDPVYRDHELVGLSQVVVPNNYNAKVNQFNEIVHNSLERSKQDGLDITGVEEAIYSSVELKSSDAVKEESMTKKEKDASEIEAVKNDAEAEVVETPTEKVEVVETPKVETPAEPEVEAPAKTEVEAPKVEEPVKVESAAVATEPEEEPEVPAEEEPTPVVPETPVENKTNKTEEKLEMTAEQIAEIVANALKPLQEELTATKAVAQNALDAQAKEPEFVAVTPEVAKNEYDDLSSDELFAKQLNAAVAVERMQSPEGAKVLHEINARNLQALKDQKIVNAALQLTDLGNFVIAPELYTQITGVRTDYSAIIEATNWHETSSLDFAWLTRGNDIDMTNVAIGVFTDTGSRLKPVSTPSYSTNTERLEELAAVTPVSINVIKFAAADILSDVAEGYRNDYDRKRAQLVIVRLQQAVNTTHNKFAFDISDGLLNWINVVAKLSDVTTVGTLIMNSKTLALLKGEAVNANFNNMLVEVGTGTIFGTPFLIVPNDLLPTLNAAETKSFAVYGSNVTIDQAVFYGDLRTFTGRSSGGLKYDVDGSASYEISGTVYSAYQRNEIVIRGSFFRGGVIRDPQVIASIPAVAVS